MHSNIEYSCELCNTICMGRDPLYSHVAKKHQNKGWVPDPDTKFICDFCGKEFTTKHSIRNHMLQHMSKLLLLMIFMNANRRPILLFFR